MNESCGLLLEKRMNGTHVFSSSSPRRQARILHWYANRAIAWDPNVGFEFDWYESWAWKYEGNIFITLYRVSKKIMVLGHSVTKSFTKISEWQ